MTKKYGFFGPYASWAEVEKECSGYASELIFDKIKAAALLAKNGQRAFERDGVAFAQKTYNWPLAYLIEHAAAVLGRPLRVVDFGGSLGSSYYQNRDLTSDHLASWTVVEQAKLAAIGQAGFADSTLAFASDLHKQLAKTQADLIVFASVLQYLKNPLEYIEAAAANGVKYLLIDRTPVHETGGDLILKQIVPPQIYEASYPLRAFDENMLKEALATRYRLIAQFDSNESKSFTLSGTKIAFKGYMFELK